MAFDTKRVISILGRPRPAPHVHGATRRVALIVGSTLALLFANAAYAQATINDCEKIQAADAYNQCLAKFGPPAKSGNLEPERPGDIKSSSAEAAATAQKGPRLRGHGARRHRGRAVRAARHGGRKRLSITVKK